MRANMRPRHREAAMMTDQPLPEAVIDQPGIADRAGEAMPASTAQRQRRVAAAIEEKQRLFAPLDRKADLLLKNWRDEAAARGNFAPEVDGFNMRHVLATEPRWQGY